MAEAARLDDLADSLPVPPAEAADDNGTKGFNGTAGDAEPVEHPAETPEPPSSPPEPDALDKLLSEWDERNGAGNGAAADLTSDYTDDELAQLLGETNQDAAAQLRNEQEFQAAQQRFAADSARSAMDLARREQENAELRGAVHQLQQAIAAEQFRQHQQRSFEDFKRLTADEQTKLADIPDIADNHVETFLLAEAARDPELQRAFEGRYYTPPGPLQRAELERAIVQHGENLARQALQIADPQQRRLAEQHIHAELRRLYENTFPDPATYRANAAKYVNKALERMHRDARKPRLDLQISGDVLAVAQAVRGASAKSAPPEPPVRLSELSDSDLNKYTRQFGYLALSR
jgi:hypothetical protein